MIGSMVLPEVKNNIIDGCNGSVYAARILELVSGLCEQWDNIMDGYRKSMSLISFLNICLILIFLYLYFILYIGITIVYLA